jgi:hypothetical protein
MATTLKDVLHEIVEHLDLDANHKARLQEDVDLHDDPQAQAEKEKGDTAERAAKRAELQAQLDALQPEPTPVPAPTQTPIGQTGPTAASPFGVQTVPPVQGA